MKTLIVLLVALVVITEAALDDATLSQQWESYKETFQKDYESVFEEALRKIIFMKNVFLIEAHNTAYDMGFASFKLGINKYADMSHDEFVKTMNGLKPRFTKEKKSEEAKFVAPSLAALPDEVDWRDRGAVTEIKDQQQCGSCWAFAATGALEAQNFKKSGQLVPLSEQNLMDCSGTNYGTMGCQGGFPDDAFQYIIDNGGIESERTYAYTAQVGNCHYNHLNAAATVSQFFDVPESDEPHLQEAVATIGPISVGINASLENFQFYTHGIYTDSGCSPDLVNHAVLVVGYGNENGKKYWLVKNSWGKDWGENGYVRIARDSGNMCGIANIASYPQV